MRRIIDFFKRLFFKKERKLETEKEQILIKPEQKKEVTKVQVREKKRKFDLLIKNLEENREKIIQEQKENELKILPSKNEGEVLIQLQKKLFLLDKEGLDLFNEEFNTLEYILIIEYSKNDYYLARENKRTGKKDFFHRWLMKESIEDFCMNKNLSSNEVVVHHINFATFNNKKNNLEVMTKKEHDVLHNRQ